VDVSLHVRGANVYTERFYTSIRGAIRLVWGETSMDVSPHVGPWGEKSMGESTMGQNVYSAGETSMGRHDRGAKRPYMGRNVHGANCQWGKKSINLTFCTVFFGLRRARTRGPILTTTMLYDVLPHN